MSLTTWKAEYYPIPADQCPREQAVAHSLRKWIGLRSENLTRHGVRATDSDDIEDAHTTEAFYVDEITCSLCATHAHCHGCSLKYYECGDGMAAWRDNHNPEPMIAALEAALKLEQSQDAPA
jgi:hypothetical protein